jgi:hypothetical protein
VRRGVAEPLQIDQLVLHGLSGQTASRCVQDGFLHPRLSADAVFVSADAIVVSCCQ